MHPRTRTRRQLILALASLSLRSATATKAPPTRLEAPNVVVIHPRLLTSGQPTRRALESLRLLGIESVVYLAPPTVSDAIRDEPELLERQGIGYSNIPIPFDAPQERHWRAFTDTLMALADRKVLVHCQINLRASSMTFLHRVIALREPPDKAYEAVAKVWTPDPVWKAFLLLVLRANGIDFEPY
jgi:protein tyrosine phosphatase (PTP) superfamily phosphohydrolase (DUF442 family)